MEMLPRKSYPRALPHRSPEVVAAETERRHEQMQDRVEDLAAEAGQLRRCTYALGLTLAGAALLATMVTVFMLQRANSADSGKPAIEALSAETIKPVPTPSKPAAPASHQPPPEGVAPVKELPSPPSSAPDTAMKDMALEAMGGLSAANLYQSYLTIGLLADGVASKAFTVEGAANTLKIVASCLTLVDNKLAKLDKMSLDPDDHASLQQIKAVTALMRIQTHALETFWATGKTEHGDAYQRARKATWTGLSKVLGVEGS
jgi:hypothetical protein